MGLKTINEINPKAGDVIYCPTNKYHYLKLATGDIVCMDDKLHTSEQNVLKDSGNWRGWVLLTPRTTDTQTGTLEDFPHIKKGQDYDPALSGGSFLSKAIDRGLVTGTLEELNVKPGDVVECVDIVREANRHYVTLGKKYTINNNGAYIDDEGDECRGFSELFRLISRATPPLTIEAGKYYKTRDGRKVYVDTKGSSYYGGDSFFTGCGYSILPSGREYRDEMSPRDLISEWTATPPTWCEMTGAEKGALLLAELDGECLEQKGRVIVNGESLFRWAPKQEGCWLDKFAYRIKPEPLVETVTAYADQNLGGGFEVNSHCEHWPFRITFNTTDGEPDLDSIKMERINE